MSETALFPALLRFWRQRRGLSQLDLSIHADVSARHISFLETGRSKPSRAMILRLAAVIDVPMREQNLMLEAAGFAPAFDEDDGDALLEGPLGDALRRMMNAHEPYPMFVVNGVYELRMANQAAARMLGILLPGFHNDGDSSQGDTPPLNLLKVFFESDIVRTTVKNWNEVAHDFLMRLHRECLRNPHDEARGALLAEVLALPSVPAEWRQPNLAGSAQPLATFTFHMAGQDLRFLTTITMFNAPQNAALQELTIESYFPLDEATARFCEMAAGQSPG